MQEFRATTETAASGPSDQELDGASDDEMFDLIDKELGLSSAPPGSRPPAPCPALTDIEGQRSALTPERHR